MSEYNTSTEQFKTYWVVDDVKIESYSTVKTLVNKGKTAIEVSAEQQLIADQNRKAEARRIAALDEKIRKEAAERAAPHSGGRVTGDIGGIPELDDFIPYRTNPLR